MKYKDKQDQNKITKEISKDTILEYLSENPDFIIKNVDLLNKMFVLKKIIQMLFLLKILE